MKTVPPTMKWTLNVAMPLTRWNALNVAANRKTKSSNRAPGGLEFSRFSIVAVDVVLARSVSLRGPCRRLRFLGQEASKRGAA